MPKMLRLNGLTGFGKAYRDFEDDGTTCDILIKIVNKLMFYINFMYCNVNVFNL